MGWVWAGWGALLPFLVPGCSSLMSPTVLLFAPTLAPIFALQQVPRRPCLARRGNREAVHHQRCARLLAEGSWQHGLTMHSASEWTRATKRLHSNPGTYLGVYDGRGLLYLGNQARNLKSDNLSF